MWGRVWNFLFLFCWICLRKRSSSGLPFQKGFTYKSVSVLPWCCTVPVLQVAGLLAPWLHIAQLLLASNISQVGFSGFVIFVVFKWSVWELSGPAVSRCGGGATGGLGQRGCGTTVSRVGFPDEDFTVESPQLSSL